MSVAGILAQEEAPDYRAPAFSIFVEGTELGEDVTGHVQAVSWEHAMDMASALELTVENTDHRFTDSPIFAPGNEVELRLGYGSDLRFVGRGEIVRHLPNFPQDDAPTLTIKAWDRSHRMMRTETRLTGGKDKRPKKEGGAESGTVHKGTLGVVLTELLGKHGISLLIGDDLVDKDVSFLQRKGTSDYKILRALANLNDADFSIEWIPRDLSRGTDPTVLSGGDTGGEWACKFYRRGHIGQGEVRYTFTYGKGDDSTLLEVGLDYGLPHRPTEIKAFLFNRDTGDWDVITHEKATAAKVEQFKPGTYAAGGAIGERTIAGGDAAIPVESMSRIMLAVQGHGIEILTRPFRNAAEAQDFVLNWYSRHRDSFILAHGRLPGVEPLRAGQIHTLEGIGRRYSGSYLFSRVRHAWTDDGYECEFTARKEIEP